MCVVIADSKKENKTGVDMSCSSYDDTRLDHHDDFDYFLNNLGPFVLLDGHNTHFDLEFL
jgi:hypothetical protein